MHVPFKEDAVYFVKVLFLKIYCKVAFMMLTNFYNTRNVYRKQKLGHIRGEDDKVIAQRDKTRKKLN